MSWVVQKQTLRWSLEHKVFAMTNACERKEKKGGQKKNWNCDKALGNPVVVLEQELPIRVSCVRPRRHILAQPLDMACPGKDMTLGR